MQKRTAGNPGLRHLPGTEIKTYHVFVDDEIFPFNQHLIKPCSKEELTNKRSEECSITGYQEHAVP